MRIVVGLALLASAGGGSRADTQPLLGEWYGVLQPPYDPPLRLALHIRTAGLDGYLGSLDSVDQGIQGIAVAKISLDGQAIAFDVPAIRAHYRGTWDPGAGRWIGTWDQGTVLALDLSRSPAASAIVRPQTPQKPYPYREEDVSYDNVSARVHLAGTLTTPPGHGPFPAAILIAGSGPNNRDEMVYGHRPFLVLADYLTRQGIAVLRVDKRGVGASSGNLEDATTRDLADDVEAGLQYLRTRRDIDPARIGLIGHSEGGLIAPLVAAHDSKVAFLVLLAAPGVRGDRLLLEQARLTAADLGLSDARIAAASAIDAKIFEAVEATRHPKEARDKVRDLLLTDAHLGTPDAAIEAKAEQAGSRWFMYFLDHDPAPTLQQVRCPVLAIGGSNDHQVPAAANLAAIRTALAADPDAQTIELPRLNHMLQSSKTGSVLEYGQLQETIAPSALHLIASWVVAHAR